MMKSNISELPRFVEMAAKLGANSVNATHMVPFAPLNTAQESCTLIKEETNEMLAQAASRAAQLGLRFSGPQPFGATAQNNTGAQAVQRFTLPASTSTLDAGHCPFPWHFAAFDMYGNVNPCGWWHHEPCMGNIRSDSFLSIWNGKRYRRLRAEHACGELREACRNCPAAGLGRVDNQRAFAER